MPKVNKKESEDFKADGWANLILSMNGKKDKSAGFDYQTNKELSFDDQDLIYNGDAIAARICDLPAQDMTRQGIDINHKDADVFYEEYENLNLWSVIEDALRYDAVYGGSAIIMDIDDGEEDWAIPVNFNKIKGINDIFAVDRHYLSALNNNVIKRPELFTITGLDTQQQIHVSRLLLFTGIDTGLRNRQAKNGFGQSRIDRVIQAIRNYSIGHNVLPNIIIEFVQSIFKLKGMKEKISEGKESVIEKRMMYLTAMTNASNKIIMDTDDDYINRSINVSGIDNIIGMIERRLCAEAGIPHTHLLQESPGASLSQSGDSQTRQWYDWIKSQQIKKLNLPINKINNVICAYKGIKNPKEVNFEFISLYQEKESEIVNNRRVVAETDQIYKNMGLSPETIIRNRFLDGQYSYETSLEESDLLDVKNNSEMLDKKNIQSNDLNVVSENPKPDKPLKESKPKENITKVTEKNLITGENVQKDKPLDNPVTIPNNKKVKQ